MTRAGWIVNESRDQPLAQDNIWLESQCDTVNFKFRIPSKKIEEIKSCINDALSLGTLKVKDVARVVGKLISF